MNLDDVADELYAGPPGNFVDRRGELAKAAVAAGDRALATSIRELRRPTTGAWLVNLLAHQAGEDLRAYLELGERLRDAQANLRGDRIRALSHERQQAAARLVARAADLAGQPVGPQASREIEETLQAAVADPAAVDAVASGRLTRALSYAGIGEVDVTDATATPLTSSAPRKPATRRPARPSAQASDRSSSGGAGAPAKDGKPADEAKQSQQVQQEAREAQEALEKQRAVALERVREATESADAARAASDRSQARLEQARACSDDLKQRVRELQEEVKATRQQVASSRDEVAGAEQGQRAAARELRDAEKAVERARRHAAALGADATN